MIEIEDYIKDLSYINSFSQYSRRISRVVHIGDVPLGGNFPIRIQSMTTAHTMDTKGSVEQSIRMIEAGCDYVRITAPSLKEAENLKVIKEELLKKGYKTPLIADIHFTPNAAELAARYVEKVRVNPGNYADKKKFESIEYSDVQYEAELERIRKRFTPLVNVCKEYGTAMRIGTNHGSLSDRIMSKYGDTPVGMVESAMEFLRICVDLDYHEIVLSMKASNPMVMVQAYRLLVAKMNEEGMNYPLHLGVTEAGDGEDGRIKSAIGIGTLLEDGLGDTVRVSLTEEPEAEVPVCIKLVKRYSGLQSEITESLALNNIIDLNKDGLAYFNPYVFSKRKTTQVFNTGNENEPRVILNFSALDKISFKSLESAGYIYNSATDKWNMEDAAADFIYFGNKVPEFSLPITLNAIYDYEIWLDHLDQSNVFPIINLQDFFKTDKKVFSEKLNFISADIEELSPEVLKVITLTENIVLLISSKHKYAYPVFRQFIYELKKMNIKLPIVVKRTYNDQEDSEKLIIDAATDTGSLFIEGIGDGIWLETDIKKDSLASIKFTNNLSFGILQAARARISKTEYISCPSCGRTLFDLQETTAAIRKETAHLKGVKIGIMGCIVNGPGEMADADYGYVGTGPGKITLYKNKDVVKRNINSDNAINELITLIKEDGKWKNR